jgi:hypothetical protein
VKATFTGRAHQIKRSPWNSVNTDVSEIELDLAGNVEGAVQTAKTAHFKGILQLKPIIADRLVFGSTFTLTLDDGQKEETK